MSADLAGLASGGPVSGSLAATALILARTLDDGAGLATAAVARELRATLLALAAGGGGDDDGTQTLLAELSTPVLDGPQPVAGRRTARGSARSRELLGKPLMPWQQHVADIALEVDPATGRLAYREVVLTVPRQAGKTAARAGGQDAPLPRVRRARRTCSTPPRTGSTRWRSGRTTRSRRCRPRRCPGCSPSAASAARRRSAGRTGPAGASPRRTSPPATPRRSTWGSWTRPGPGSTTSWRPACRPTMITRPQSTAVDRVSTAGTAASTWLRGKVDAGREQPDGRRTAYFEWSAPADADPADPATWWACIPSLGHTVTEDAIRAEYDRLDPDAFARSYLQPVARRATGRRVAGDHRGDWQACLDPRSQHVGRVAFALDVSPDRAWASIAAAGRRADGLTHVELVDHRPGTGWVVERLAELVAAAQPARRCGRPGQRGRRAAARPGRRRDRAWSRPTARDVAGAAGALYDATRPDAADDPPHRPARPDCRRCRCRPAAPGGRLDVEPARRHRLHHPAGRLLAGGLGLRLLARGPAFRGRGMRVGLGEGGRPAPSPRSLAWLVMSTRSAKSVSLA